VYVGSVVIGMILFFGSVFGLPALWEWRLDVADKKATKNPGLSQDFRAMLDKDAELKAWWEEQIKLTRADELPEMEEVRNVTEEARSEEGPDDEWIEEEVLTEAMQKLWRVFYSDWTEVDGVQAVQAASDEHTVTGWCGCSWTTRGEPDDWERKYHCTRHRPEDTVCMHGGSICF
jgi:hypothetical protein